MKLGTPTRLRREIEIPTRNPRSYSGCRISRILSRTHRPDLQCDRTPRRDLSHQIVKILNRDNRDHTRLPAGQNRSRCAQRPDGMINSVWQNLVSDFNTCSHITYKAHLPTDSEASWADIGCDNLSGRTSSLVSVRRAPKRALTSQTQNDAPDRSPRFDESMSIYSLRECKPLRDQGKTTVRDTLKKGLDKCSRGLWQLLGRHRSSSENPQSLPGGLPTLVLLVTSNGTFL